MFMLENKMLKNDDEDTKQDEKRTEETTEVQQEAVLAESMVDAKKLGQEEKVLAVGPLKLAPGRSYYDLVALFLHFLATVLLLSFVHAFQAFLLDDVYAVPSDEWGKVTGTLAIVDEILSFFFLFLWGLISDKLGRRFVCVTGYLLVCLSLLLMPHGNTVYPGLLLIRLTFALGVASLTSMMTALLSDIVATDSLGYGSGLAGFASGIGAVISIFVFVGVLPKYVCITGTYYVAAAVPFLMSLVIWKAVKGSTKEQRMEKKEYKYTSLIGDSFSAIIENPRLAVSYIGGLCARGGPVVVSVYVSLWVNHYYTVNDLCGENNSTGTKVSVCGEVLENSEKESCAAAFTTTSILGGTIQTVALISALLFGYLSNRGSNTIIGLGIWAAFATIAYALVEILNDDPTNKLSYLVAVLIGIGEMSVVIYAQVLVTEEMSRYEKIKGTIAGWFSMFGSLGVILVTFLGGFLFDAWKTTAPFILMSIAFAILLLSCVACYIYELHVNGKPILKKSSIAAEK